MWAGGSLATGSVYNAMALFSLFFLTQVLGIAPALAGTLLLITKAYDAITDPLMGAISDRTHHSAGRRRPYLLLGAVLLGAGFALFFNAPLASGTTLIVIVFGLLILQSTGYTVFAVPYLAMAPDIAKSYDDRTRLMALRVAFLILGVMLGSVGGPYIVGLGADPRDGYALLGMSLGVFVVVCGVFAYFGTAGVESGDAEAIADARKSGLSSSFGDMASVFGQRPFRLLVLVKLLQLVVLALALACTPYFFQYVLQRPPADIGQYLMTFSLTGLASIPVWRMLIARYGKREVYMISILGYGLGLCTWWWWTPAEAEAYFYARAVVLGILSNGTLLCALSLLPDTMEYDRLESRRNREGVMSGVFTTVEKISGALGPFLIGILLQSMGLIAGRDPGIVQPESALTAIHLGVSLVPALVCFAAIPLLWLYDLGPEKLRAMREAAGEAAPAN